MCSHKVGTDAPFYPPEHNQEKPPQAPPKEGMLPNGMPYKGKWVGRRGRLSLQVLHSFQQNKQLVNLSTRPLVHST